MRRRILTGLKIIFWIWLVNSNELLCQPLNDTQQRGDNREAFARLELLDKRVGSEQAKQRALELKQAKLTDAIRAEEAQIEQIRSATTLLQEQLAENQRQRTGLKLEQEGANIKISELRQAARRRLRSLYALSRMNQGAIDSLVRSTSRTISPGPDASNPITSNRDALKDLYLLQKVSAYDARTLANLKLLQLQSEQRAIQLLEVQSINEGLKAALEGRDNTLSEKLQKRRQLLEDFQRRQGQIALGLTKLKDEAIKLEKIVASLAGGAVIADTHQPGSPGGSYVKENREDLARKQQPQPEKSPAQVAVMASQQNETSERIQGIRGPLAFPIDGEVLQQFGKHRVADFSDLVVSKGVEFVAPLGAPVKAIARGLVRFVGKMPGYGQVIIIDHGERDYSLYGRIETAKVAVGQLVSRSQVLGTVGATDNRGRNFYFEIRKAGIPRNPMVLLRTQTP